MFNIMDDIKKKKNVVIKRLPLIAKKINVLLSDPNLSIERLSEVIKMDSALVVNVMKVANLSFGYVSKYNEISTIPQAVTRLGIDKVISLAMSTALLKNFQVAEKSLEKDLWQESIVTAVSSELIATECNLKNGEELFALGLLRNVGMLVILDLLDVNSSMYNQYYSILKTKYKNGGDISYLERDQFGADHLEVCQYILKLWNFPEFLVQCINPKLTTNGELNKKIIGITRINILAEKIADYLIFKNIFSYSQIFSFAKQYFNFSYDKTIDLLSAINSQVERYSQMLRLKIVLPNQTDILDISSKKIKKGVIENKNAMYEAQESLKDTVHDINGFLSLLQATIEKSAVEAERGNIEKTKSFLKHAGICVNHTKDYLNGIYHHFDTNDTKEANISQVLKRFVNLFDNVTSEKIKIDCHIKDNFSFVGIKADAVFKILFNICKNAVDAIEERIEKREGEGRIKIKLENIEIKDATDKKEKRPYIQLAIADNGIGIPDHVGDKIFKDSFSTKKDNRGRGLTIAQKIVAGCGGIINYKTKWNCTVFYVILPRVFNIQEARKSA